MKRVDNNNFLEALEKLPSEQLHEILRQELERSHMDKELIFQIWSILEQRYVQQPHEEDPQVTAAWLRFQAAYNTPVGDETPRRVHKRRRWLAGAAAAAAIVCLIVMFTPTVQGKLNLFEAIGQWTQELFGFFSGGQSDDYTFTTDNPDLQEIYDAVAEQGVTRPVVPTWIPEGFELQEVKKLSSTAGDKIHARLSNGDNYILLTYEVHSEAVTNKYAKDDTDVEQYETGGIKHYLMSNAETWTVAWTVDNLECSIATNLDKDTLYQIIRSIYRR